MGSIDNANGKFSAFVAAVASNPFFHLAMPLIAGALLYSEQRMPNLKEGIAGALLLMSNIGRVMGSIMDFVTKSQAAKQDPEHK